MEAAENQLKNINKTMHEKPIKVSELIEMLQRHDPDMRVMARMEGGSVFHIENISVQDYETKTPGAPTQFQGRRLHLHIYQP